MSLALDLAAVIIIAVFAIATYKKGFLNAAAVFLGTIVSFVMAVSVSGPAARFIFDSYISDNVNSVVMKHMGNISQNDVTAFSEGMRELIDEMPSLISGMMENGFGVHVDEWYDKIMASDAESVSQAVNDVIIAPLATGLLRVLAFFVLFFVLMLAVNVIAGLLTGVNMLPLIGPLNELLGGVLGGIQGMLYVFVLAAVLWFALSAAGGEIGPISEQTVEQTWLFKYFYDIGPWVEMTADLL